MNDNDNDNDWLVVWNIFGFSIIYTVGYRGLLSVAVVHSSDAVQPPPRSEAFRNFVWPAAEKQREAKLRSMVEFVQHASPSAGSIKPASGLRMPFKIWCSKPRIWRPFPKTKRITWIKAARVGFNKPHCRASNPSVKCWCSKKGRANWFHVCTKWQSLRN